MLSIEDTKNLSSKVKYCLIKISIDNFNEISSLMKAEGKNSLIYKFSNFLFKNLRKKDIYLMSEPGKFLVIFAGYGGCCRYSNEKNNKHLQKKNSVRT